MALLERWRYDSGITLVGDDVSLWVGTEGLVTVEQTTALNRPVFETSVHNGHDALRFDAAEWLQALSATDLELGTNDLTMACVMRPDIDEFNYVMGKSDGNGTVQDAYFLQVETGENLNSKVSDGSGNRITKIGSTGAFDGTGISIHLASLDFSTKALINHVDGAVDEASQSNNGGGLIDVDSAEKFKIGWASTEPSVRFSGYIFEVRIYDSIEDLDALHATLNAFYSAAGGGPTPPPAGGTLFSSNSLYIA